MEGSGGIHCQYMNVEDEILNFYRRHIPARHSFLDVKSMTCKVQCDIRMCKARLATTRVRRDGTIVDQPNA